MSNLRDKKDLCNASLVNKMFEGECRKLLLKTFRIRSRHTPDHIYRYIEVIKVRGKCHETHMFAIDPEKETCVKMLSAYIDLAAEFGSQIKLIQFMWPHFFVANDMINYLLSLLTDLVTLRIHISRPFTQNQESLKIRVKLPKVTDLSVYFHREATAATLAESVATALLSICPNVTYFETNGSCITFCSAILRNRKSFPHLQAVDLPVDLATFSPVIGRGVIINFWPSTVSAVPLKALHLLLKGHKNEGQRLTELPGNCADTLEQLLW